MDARTALEGVCFRPDDLAKALSEAAGQRTTHAQVREIAKEGELLGRDRKIDLLQFAAFLLT